MGLGLELLRDLASLLLAPRIIFGIRRRTVGRATALKTVAGYTSPTVRCEAEEVGLALCNLIASDKKLIPTLFWKIQH